MRASFRLMFTLRGCAKWWKNPPSQTLCRGPSVGRLPEDTRGAISIRPERNVAVVRRPNRSEVASAKREAPCSPTRSEVVDPNGRFLRHPLQRQSVFRPVTSVDGYMDEAVMPATGPFRFDPRAGAFADLRLLKTRRERRQVIRLQKKQT